MLAPEGGREALALDGEINLPARHLDMLSWFLSDHGDRLECVCVVMKSLISY